MSVIDNNSTGWRGGLGATELMHLVSLFKVLNILDDDYHFYCKDLDFIHKRLKDE